MKFLITGGGGFLGSALAERILSLQDDAEITLFDTNFSHNAYAFSTLPGNPAVSLIEADVLDWRAVADAVFDHDVVIHMAARLGVREVTEHSSYTLRVNFLGSANVLDAALESKDILQVIFFSTSEVYGSNAFRVVEGGNSVFRSLQDARWCYSISKLAAEHLAFAYFREQGLPVTVVRPFNIFGPRRIGDNVIRRFVMAALRDQPLTVYGNGTQIRAWCHVSDFVGAVTRMIGKEDAIGQAFNVGNMQNTVTAFMLAKKVIEIAGSDSRIVFARPDITDIDIRVPDVTKLELILDFSPRIDLDSGLADTVSWFREHLVEVERFLGGADVNDQ